MDYSFDDDMYTNEVEYFFSLHGPRFEYMNKSMASSLSRRFGKKFRPIRILNAWPAKQYAKANYIILNEKAYGLSKELKKPVVYLPDYEDVNEEFSRNKFINNVANQLLKKQETVYVYPFTTSFLKLPKEIFTVLGPDSELTTVFDNKINQFQLFSKLRLPCNKARIFANVETLLKEKSRILPGYLSAAYTSGGNESALIYDKMMLREFLARIRRINKNNPFIIANIFEDIVLAPNVNALITSNGKVFVLVLSDQILHGNRYLGNTYPSVVTNEHRKQIYSMTKKLGTHLADQGYRGLFGCDFLISASGQLIVVDLNPRHQGGYACNQLALQKMGISLADIELATLQDEDVTLSQTKLDAYAGFAWSHSKLLPTEKGQVIHNEYHHGTIEKPFTEIGTSFVSEFYKQGSVFIEGYIGYQLTTAGDRDQLEAKMLHTKEQFDAHVLGL